jgi:hypothetical protein
MPTSAMPDVTHVRLRIRIPPPSRTVQRFNDARVFGVIWTSKFFAKHVEAAEDSVATAPLEADTLTQNR